MTVSVTLYNQTARLLTSQTMSYSNLHLALLSASASFTASHTSKRQVDNGSTSTVTITNASPGVVSWSSHGLSNGNPVSFTTSGSLPTGLSAGTMYYVVSAAANTFQVSATSGGSAINTSSAGSGTHTAWASGSYEVFLGGWGGGGQLLTTVTDSTTTTNDAKITADNLAVTATSVDIGPFHYGLIYDLNTLNVLAFIDWGTVFTAGVGTQCLVTWDSAGVFSITY